MKFCFTLLSARFGELKKVRCKILPRLLYGSSVIVPLMLFADGRDREFLQLAALSCGKRDGLNFNRFV